MPSPGTDEVPARGERNVLPSQLCPASGGRFPSERLIICPGCGRRVRLYRGRIPNHRLLGPQEGEQ